jgi:hypothetical protein
VLQTLRLSPDVRDAFRAMGPGWQTLTVAFSIECQANKFHDAALEEVCEIAGPENYWLKDKRHADVMGMAARRKTETGSVPGCRSISARVRPKTPLTQARYSRACSIYAEAYPAFRK